jgi:hypothetical protein
MKIADVLSRQNQAQDALQYLGKSRAISEQLAKLDSSNAVWKEDLVWVEDKIAELKGVAPK